MDYVEALCKTGNEPIGSLGYDGPLAALSPEKQSLADYFKEAVAVVTNPAMDREREMEHFSTRMTLGARPGLSAGSAAARARGRAEGADPARSRDARPAPERRQD